MLKAKGKLKWIQIHAPWCQLSQNWRRQVFQNPAIQALLPHFDYVEYECDADPSLDAAAQDLLTRMEIPSGWPCHLILTPKGFPLIGFTSLETDGVLEILSQALQALTLDEKELERISEDRFQELIPQHHPSAGPHKWNFEKLCFLTPLSQSLSSQFGLIGKSHFYLYPKAYQFLLGEKDQLPLCERALSRLASSPLADIVGGGFFRAFFVDKGATELATEKLLGQNAELLEVFVEAWQKTKNSFFLQVTNDLVQFILRDFALMANQKILGFSSSLSAHPTAYVITASDLIMKLPAKDRILAQKFFAISNQPSLPKFSGSLEQVAQDCDLAPVDALKAIMEIRSQLVRTRPYLEKGHRHRYTEAVAIRSLLKAFQAQTGVSKASEDLEDQLIAILFDNAKEANSPLEKVAIARAFLAADLYAEALNLLNSLPLHQPENLLCAPGFVTPRWILKDHLGTSLISEWLMAWQEINHQTPSKPYSVQLEKQIRSFLEQARRLGVQAASLYVVAQKFYQEHAHE